MSFDMLGQLNWLAVVVAGAAYFALGALWFAPQVLGGIWQRSIGWDPNQSPPRPSARSYGPAAIAYLVAAVATAMLAAATGADDVSGAITLGLVVGIGYALTLTAVTAGFAPNLPQPWTWFAVSGGYHLVGLVITSLIVTLWR